MSSSWCCQILFGFQVQGVTAEIFMKCLTFRFTMSTLLNPDHLSHSHLFKVNIFACMWRVWCKRWFAPSNRGVKEKWISLMKAVFLSGLRKRKTFILQSVTLFLFLPSLRLFLLFLLKMSYIWCPKFESQHVPLMCWVTLSHDPGVQWFVPLSWVTYHMLLLGMSEWLNANPILRTCTYRDG